MNINNLISTTNSSTTYQENNSVSQDTISEDYVDTTFWWILWFVSTFTVIGLCIYIKSDHYEKSCQKSRRQQEHYREINIYSK